MRRIIGIAAVLVSFLSAFQANGQAIGGEWEVYQVHYGTVGTTDLTGYVTYRLALTMQNEADIVSAVFGSESGQACDNIAEGVDIDLHFDCNVFQVPTGGPTLDDINCGFISFVPELEYDSYVTIDRFCNDDAGPFFTTPWLPSCGSFATWEAGGDLFIDDGAWFVTYPGNGPAGADNKIYVMQVTTCGNITGCLWVSTFVNGLQSQIEDTQVCFDIENPCESNPLDPQVNIIDDIDCFGELATVEIGDGSANGAISYTMFVNDVPQTPQSTNSYTNLSANTNYFVAVEDEIGCRDTSEVFFFTEPPLLVLQSELTEDVMCFGDTDAVITNDYQGGTDPVTFYLNDDMANGVSMGTNFENLGCGSYEVMVEDNNGCRDSIIFEVACPAQLLFDPNVTNSSCNALDNGSIQGNLTGGTGTTTASWTSSVDVTFNETFTGTTPLNISIANLEPAIYTISVEDANGCLLTAEFEITEPDPMITVVTPTPASCNGISDGSIDASASGGTPDYSFSNQELGGGTVPFAGLPAGEYVVITEDEQGCQVFDTVEVLQPAAVLFDSLTVEDVSCFGLCDGLIQFNGLGGGEGNIVLNSIPFLTQNGTGDGFIDACQGNYTILALDEGNNCSYSIASAEIIEPAELIMDVVVSEIDCFGSTNGGFVVNCSGGTGTIEVMINDTLMDCGMPLDSLLPGNFLITLTDETLCTTSQTFTLEEPDELLLTILSTTDLTCGGDSDGAVIFDFEGGTPATTGDPYSFLLNGVPSTLIDLIQLEAGDYELCVEDGNMCLACDTFAINEPEPISFLFNITNTSCTGMSDGAINVFVGGGTGPIDVTFDPPNLNTNALPEGGYIVYAMDSVGCTGQDTAFVEADIITDLAVEVYTTPLTCWNTGDGTATAGVTGGMLPYIVQWGDPDLQTTFTALGLEEGSYNLLVIDAQGCEVDTIAVIEPNVGCFFISTAATPNGDGVNDEWIVGGLEYYPSAIVQVFNRWGQQLYESRGTYVPWDCTYNGRTVATGDYYYVIDFADDTEPITGTVTIRY